jgi:hypothetical protein
MSDTATDVVQKKSEGEGAEAGALTDGFHLIIDALKLNDITTIYGVPGIPITDFGRYAQAAGASSPSGTSSTRATRRRSPAT